MKEKKKEEKLVSIFEKPEWREMNMAYYTGDYNSLLSIAEGLNDEYPDTKPVLAALGNAYSNLGERELAIHWFDKATKQGKAETKDAKMGVGLAWNWMGEMLDKEGDSAGALNAYLKAVEDCPGCAPAFENLGKKYMDLDLLDEAVEAFELLVEASPKASFSWGKLGHALGAAGRYEEAHKALKTSFEFRPGNYRTLFLLGMTFYSLAIMKKDQGEFPFAGQILYRQAAAYFRAAVRKDPDDMMVWHLLAGSLMRIDKYEEAYKIQRKVSKVDREAGFSILETLERLRRGEDDNKA